MAHTPRPKQARRLAALAENGLEIRVNKKSTGFRGATQEVTDFGMSEQRKHTDRAYEQDLETLRQRLLMMAARVEGMIENSIRALVERDSELAHRTILSDRVVNRMEIEIDEMCLLILAKRQPLASDLRFIAYSMKMVTDLERIGDLAANVCERAIALNKEPMVKPLVGISRAAEIAEAMIGQAIDAFVKRDVDRAQAVLDRDNEMDQMYRDVFKEWLLLMEGDPAVVDRGIQVQSVAKYLERIADHATNLAEQVIFMVAGRDVRHHGKLTTPVE